jgi:hypothetical protein
MNAKQSTELDLEIESIEDQIKILEYDFVMARNFAERREIYLKHNKKKNERQMLINQQDYD